MSDNKKLVEAVLKLKEQLKKQRAELEDGDAYFGIYDSEEEYARDAGWRDGALSVIGDVEEILNSI